MNSKMIFCDTEETVMLPLYATTIGYWEHQVETDRPEGFPDYQIHQIHSGKGELRIKDKHYAVGPGEVFVTFPHVPHIYTPHSREWELSWISFDGREAAGMLAFSGIRESGTATLRGGQLLGSLLEMLNLPDGNEAGINLERSRLLYAMLLELKRNLLPAASGENDLERLRPVLEYIDAHLHRPLQLKELAEVGGVSPQYLCRQFSRTIHERPVTYINKQRINRSKQLLYNERGKKIHEISRLAGFENVSYFCAVFKRVTGMTPEQFKRLHGLD